MLKIDVYDNGSKDENGNSLFTVLEDGETLENLTNDMAYESIETYVREKLNIEK